MAAMLFKGFSTGSWDIKVSRYYDHVIRTHTHTHTFNFNTYVVLEVWG